MTILVSLPRNAQKAQCKGHRTLLHNSPKDTPAASFRARRVPQRCHHAAARTENRARARTSVLQSQNGLRQLHRQTHAARVRTCQLHRRKFFAAAGKTDSWAGAALVMDSVAASWFTADIDSDDCTCENGPCATLSRARVPESSITSASLPHINGNTFLRPSSGQQVPPTGADGSNETVAVNVHCLQTY
jgi:hypothetical protein